jgi:hypothetical protein
VEPRTKTRRYNEHFLCRNKIQIHDDGYTQVTAASEPNGLQMKTGRGANHRNGEWRVHKLESMHNQMKQKPILQAEIYAHVGLCLESREHDSPSACSTYVVLKVTS